MRIFHKVKTLYNVLLSTMYAAAAALLAGMFIIVIVSVIMRYFFNMPLGWVIDVVENSIIWLAFLAAAKLLRDDSHVRMDFFLNVLSSRNRLLLMTCTSFLGIVLCIVLTIFTGSTTWDYFQYGIVMESGLELPQYLMMMIIPVSFFLVSVEFIRDFHKYFAQWFSKVKSDR